MISRKFTSIILLVFQSHGEASEISLREAIKQALISSPEIRGIKSQVESLEAKANQALAPTEPTIGVQYNDMDHAFNIGNPGATVYQVTQPIGFPGKAFVNKGALDEQAKSVFFQLKSKELEVSNNTKSAYYQIALTEKFKVLNEEQRNSFEKILAIARRRYEAGSITQVDFLNAQIGLYSTGNELSDIESSYRQAQDQLNVILGNEPGESLTVRQLHVEIKTLLTNKEAERLMRENRFEIKSAIHQANASEKSYKAAKLSLLPDFQVTLGETQYNYQTASPVNPLTTTYLAGISMTIPIWSLFNERESISSASHDRAAANANVDSVSRLSRIALSSAMENLNSLKIKIENYEKHLLPLVEQSFNIALISYSSGKIDFQSLSDTASTRRSIKKDYYSLLVNYALSYSVLGQLLGEDLICE